MFKNTDPNKQYHIQCGKDDIGQYVILPGDPSRCEKIAKYLDDSHFVVSNREYVTYTGLLEGVKVSVTSTGIGGASAAIAVEELAALGAHTFIRVGTAGGMHLDVKAGDIVIPTSCIRMDGTPNEYLPVEFPAVASFDVTRCLVDEARKLTQDVHTGVIHCKDSFYSQRAPERMPIAEELEMKWRAWCRGGCLASEMESATIFIVAQVLGLHAGSILYAASNQEREKKGIDDPIADDNSWQLLQQWKQYGQ